jgi:hypothetical protein
MTWHWDIVDGDLVLWDHTQDPTADPPSETLTDGGWRWPAGGHPDAVLDVMYGEAQTAVQSGDVLRAISITLDMAGEQIERA